MSQVRINIRNAVNNSAIRREKRHGRDVIIVPSATLPDNIVMNGSKGPVLYPADEIEKGYASLENTLAPLGHPTVEGRFVSASDPVGLALAYVGAHNENVRRENGRVLMDKVIDVEIANQSERGKRLLSAIDEKKPIHTSTGLLARMEVANGQAHNYVARDMVFDHDAILLDEPGAATPEDGVGIFVNSAGDEMEVINSMIDDIADRELDWAADSALRAVEQLERAPLIEKIKDAIKAAVRGVVTPETKPQKESLSVNEEQFKALSDKVDTLANAQADISKTVSDAIAAALKPVLDHQEQLANAAKVEADAKHADLVSQVVNSGILDEATAKLADATVLDALINANKPRGTTMLNSAFKPAGDKPAALEPKE